MARPLELDDLIEHFTLRSGELEVLRNKTGATQLGFSLLITFLSWKGRFPRSRSELPDNTIEFVAKQVGVAPGELGFYDWDGRQIKRHRTEIRRATGLRECAVADADKLTAWLAEGFCRSERRPERVREQLLCRCREEKIEPPAPERIGRIVGSALHQAEQALCLRIRARIPAEGESRLMALIAHASDEDIEDRAEPEDAEVFASIKADPGNISLSTTKEVNRRSLPKPFIHERVRSTSQRTRPNLL